MYKKFRKFKVLRHFVFFVIDFLDVKNKFFLGLDLNILIILSQYITIQ